ncbi:MAG TPA: ferric reductase-like transmembrane domain-containing protein [Acidobacteriaceae bacterium]|nr:ferric reductase-like transmembrane domain-containing protein [Acidobacteriaceae bacterium]
MVDDVSRRRFITAGLAAWLMVLPVALTSTSWSIRKLGGKNWNRLHKLTYAAAIAGVIHYWWGVETGVRTPLAITIVLGILLACRPLLALKKQRAELKARSIVTT